MDINDLVGATSIAYASADLTTGFRTKIASHALAMLSGADFQQLLLAHAQFTIEIAVALKQQQGKLEANQTLVGQVNTIALTAKRLSTYPEMTESRSTNAIIAGRRNSNWLWCLRQK